MSGSVGSVRAFAELGACSLFRNPLAFGALTPCGGADTVDQRPSPFSDNLPGSMLSTFAKRCTPHGRRITWEAAALVKRCFAVRQPLPAEDVTGGKGKA